MVCRAGAGITSLKQSLQWGGENNVPIQSMTGFAQTEGENDHCSWIWDAKSVNAKGFDFRCRMPSMFAALEKQFRDRASQKLKRGAISFSLKIKWHAKEIKYRLNENAINELSDLMPEIQNYFKGANPLSMAEILNTPGVLLTEETKLDDQQLSLISTFITDDFDAALQNLVIMREQEGAELYEITNNQLLDLEKLSKNAQNIASVQPDAIIGNLRQSIADLLSTEVAEFEGRVFQEAALLVIKADTTEELDRLFAHVKAARTLINNSGAVGRKLDFLCQELNREANTLCSKSTDLELTNCGIELKSTIEQFREQVQNIE